MQFYRLVYEIKWQYTRTAVPLCAEEALTGATLTYMYSNLGDEIFEGFNVSFTNENDVYFEILNTDI